MQLFWTIRGITKIDFYSQFFEACLLHIQLTFSEFFTSNRLGIFVGVKDAFFDQPFITTIVSKTTLSFTHKTDFLLNQQDLSVTFVMSHWTHSGHLLDLP